MMRNERRTKIVATILVRNEADIIEHSLRHHISQGIRHFIATDNGSTDNTREVLASFPEVKTIIDEPKLNHDQGRWVTRMAQLAAKERPDWIVHLDADEFWCGLDRLVHEHHAGHLRVPKIYRHLLPSEEPLLQEMTHYLPKSEMAKIIHRPGSNVVLAPGNHHVYNAGDRKVVEYITVHHFPIRSYAQFEKKVVQGAEALLRQNPGSILNVGTHWQRWYRLHKAGILKDEFLKIVREDQEAIKSGKTLEWAISSS